MGCCTATQWQHRWRSPQSGQIAPRHKPPQKIQRLRLRCCDRSQSHRHRLFMWSERNPVSDRNWHVLGRVHRGYFGDGYMGLLGARHRAGKSGRTGEAGRGRKIANAVCGESGGLGQQSARFDHAQPLQQRALQPVGTADHQVEHAADVGKFRKSFHGLDGCELRGDSDQRRFELSDFHQPGNQRGGGADRAAISNVARLARGPRRRSRGRRASPCYRSELRDSCASSTTWRARALKVLATSKRS